MVDRGFLVEKEMRQRGVSVIMPPFNKATQGRFSGADALRTRKIANARIHVERMIGKVRNWRITTRLIPQSLIPQISQITYICACLTNYQAIDL